MCEYCGCQALRTIEELTREHDHVVALVGRVRAARELGDTEGMAEAARQISAVLAPHTEVEEHGLFPALADEFPDHIQDLETEHRAIEAVLADADRASTDPSWQARLLDALDMLREHILKEQDGVFPAALSRLATKDWEAAEAVRARVGIALEVPVRVGDTGIEPVTPAV